MIIALKHNLLQNIIIQYIVTYFCRFVYSFLKFFDLFGKVNTEKQRIEHFADIIEEFIAHHNKKLFKPIAKA